MAFTEKKLVTGTSQINTSETTVYTVPASTTGIVKIIWITNVTSADVQISMWNPTTGSTTSDANQLLDTVTIPSYDFVQINTYLPIAATGTIVAKMITGAASSATVNLYGAEIT